MKRLHTKNLAYREVSLGLYGQNRTLKHMKIYFQQKIIDTYLDPLDGLESARF